jgi:hypothetical protein
MVRANQKPGNLSTDPTVTSVDCCSCSCACGQRAVHFILQDLVAFDDWYLEFAAEWSGQAIPHREALIFTECAFLVGHSWINGFTILMAYGLQLSGLAWRFGWKACWSGQWSGLQAAIRSNISWMRAVVSIIDRLCLLLACLFVLSLEESRCSPISISLSWNWSTHCSSSKLPAIWHSLQLSRLWSGSN